MLMLLGLTTSPIATVLVWNVDFIVFAIARRFIILLAYCRRPRVTKVVADADLIVD